MQRVLVLASVLLISLFLGSASAGVIVKGAVVIGVNRPGDPNFTTLTIERDDRIESSGYNPTTTDASVGTVAGQKYNLFMITKSDLSQAFIVWSPDDPVWQDRLRPASSKITGLGMPGPATLKKGDKVNISTQDDPGNPNVWMVTFDIYRDNKSAGTVSFSVPKTK